MRGFNVFDPDFDLSQPAFLEASAGTGKTFAIEQLIVRLLKEKPEISFPEILVLTFTKAATLELKTRIRAALAKEKNLKEALAFFDEASIFTIHGFCFHALQEEAFVCIDQKEESASPLKARELIKDYVHAADIHPFEAKRLAKREFIEEILKLSSRRLPIVGGRAFTQIFQEFQTQIRSFQVEGPKLLEDLLRYAPCYKGMSKLKKEVTEPLAYFTSLFGRQITEKEFPEDSPLLDMEEKNLLKTAKLPQTKELHYPGIFEKIQEKLVPLMREAQDDSALIARLSEGARLFMEETSEKEDLFFYEDLLVAMEKKVKDKAFAQSLRGRYKAVFIDEFQDTDKRQWNILSTLFSRPHFAGPLFLIGDPKQSIYRFRSSDLYTYFEAKKSFSEKELLSLDTNYRSTPSLVEGLNALFTPVRDFLTLPKTGQSFPCPAVQAGKSGSLEKSVHFGVADTEEALFSWVMERSSHYPLNTCAILVKDRFQAKRFLQAAKKSGFPAIAKRCRTIFDSPHFESFYEFLDAVFHPKEISKVNLVKLHPLFAQAEEDLFFSFHTLLYERGILSLVLQALDRPCEKELYSDWMHLASQMTSLALEEHLPFLRNLKKQPEDAESVKLPFVGAPEAATVLTMHVSKGLEYEVVFPLGIILETAVRKELVYDSSTNQITPSPQAFALHLQELEAEQMRLLYVALTRAKKQLYIPVLTKYPKSPLNRFLDKLLEGKELQAFATNSPVMTFTSCENKPFRYEKELPKPSAVSQIPSLPVFESVRLSSFSSLTQGKSEKSFFTKGDTLPTGAAFGDCIHALFEKAFPFSSKESLVNLLEATPYSAFKEPLAALLLKVMEVRFEAQKPFTLADISPQNMQKEMEFLYPEGGHFLKGYIDLVFAHEGKLYFLDWKTNDLGGDYSQDALRVAMEENAYFMQARIYSEALKRSLSLCNSSLTFGGYYYFFIRGLALYKQGEVHV